jgi:cell pole-organizing protein PopZ
MEEILASIRRIIADDSTNPQHAGASATPMPKPGAELDQPDVDRLLGANDAQAGDADILELTQPVESGAGFTTVRGPDVMFREERRSQAVPAEPPAPAPAPVPAPAPRRGPPMKDPDLMSPSTTAAVSAAFHSLATTVMTENSRTIEDLVKEMMRPMLKHWLEENLPGLVERMVRAEIERVSRGGR